ncbi:MAG: hypothetical protein KJ052_11485 [Candidatus Hydrogenedentes bacterium]|nr:hypothetical protein [Candidatus Hydrogenedentota bacterium]
MKKKGTVRRIFILIAFGWAYQTYVIACPFFDWSPVVRTALGLLLLGGVIYGIVSVIAQAIAATDERHGSQNKTDDDHEF